ncbi:MAG: hypothetical protein ABI699_09300 [Caldimonas sp.]
MGLVYPLRFPPRTTYPDKEFATAQAAAALAGATLRRIEDDRGDELFVLTRLHVTRHLRDLNEVHAWIEKLSGRAG